MVSGERCREFSLEKVLVTRKLSKSVLVVDDNALVRGLLRAAFESDGFSTTEAENGRQAISLAREQKPDLVILDLSMPVMNGIDAAPRLRELLPTTPIILYTMFAESIQNQDTRKAGITETFLKSNPIHDLIVRAHELMRDGSGSAR